MSDALQILKDQFGLSEFRLNQDKIIQSVLAKKDTFVLMPTGGGKSFCFQIPSLIFDGLTVVVSPLISLMKDQVDGLRIDGIKAAYLNSSLSNEEQTEVTNQILGNRLKLLYIAPERIFSPQMQFLQLLRKLKVSLFAIDEAHCISHWGHDFRPEYLKLAILKDYFGEVPIIALTATADTLTRNDILDKLKLQNPQIFISSFNRKNIHYYVEPKRRSYHRLVEYLSLHKDNSGIIYCLSRDSVENLAADLTNDGFSAKPYHAGLAKDIRDKNQDLFIKDKVKIIVATIAFGLGIDKSNVRFVVHMDLPKNIESYYQESGRAGRDGVKSEALLFYSRGDILKLRRFVEIEKDPHQSKIMLAKLKQMAKYCETRICRRKFILNYFGEDYDGNCQTCDICLTNFEKFEGTVIAQKALSAVARVGQRFGVGYIIDFLRGSQSAKIWQVHKKIKTYGVGRDLSADEWRRYIDDLMEMGYLRLDGGQYPILKLTSKSMAVLKGEEKVMLVKPFTKMKLAETIPAYETELFTILKSIRLKLAHAAKVPAYVIFSDSTLIELAGFLPQNMLELSQISGFGEIKLKRFGDVFLNAVLDYCKSRHLTSRIHKKTKKVQRNSKRGRL